MLNILKGDAHVNPFRVSAISVLDSGYSPLPLFKKRPIIEAWSNYCDAPLTRKQISKISRDSPGAGIGLACGYAGLVAVDFDTDDPVIISIAREVFPESIVAKRGMKGRTDLYFADGATIQNRKFYGHDKKPFLEVLSRGCQTVIPGTIHPDTGRPYEWLTKRTILDTITEELTICNADAVEYLDQEFERRGLLYKKVETFKGEAFKTRADTGQIGDAERKRYAGFALAKIDARVKEIAAMGKGGRNREAFALVCAAGRFIHHGIIGLDDLKGKLIEACDKNGLNKENGVNDLMATIERGLGYSKSDELPELKERRAAPARKPRSQAKTAGAGAARYGDAPPAQAEMRGIMLWPDVCPNGEPKTRSQPNIEAFLRHVGVELAHNAFSCRNVVRRGGAEEVLDDPTLRSLWLHADRLGMKANEKYFYAVIFNICNSNRFNPVVDFLNGLTWDGKPRLDGWLSRYMGASSSPVIQKQGAIHLIAAVRRARRPGCKYDTMIVFEGPQGGGKSTAIRLLAGDEWFTDGLNIGDDAKIVLEQTADSWLVELAELAGIGKRDVEGVKSFLSRSEDSARLSYDRCNTKRGRKFICFATTNSSSYLIDNTGNRRFWPVRVGDIDLAGIAADRLQIWAEAAQREAKGESIVLPKELWQAAAAEQAARVQADPWQEMLDQHIDGRFGKVPTSEVWTLLGVDSKSQNPQLGKRILDIMKALGFEKDRQRHGGLRVHCFTKIAPTGEAPWFTLNGSAPF